jgi:Holliday junction resolvase RusA-like endonuclease
VPKEPPTQNEIAQNKGGKRFGYKRVREEFTFLVRAAMNKNGVPAATGRRRMVLTRFYTGRGRARDYGNLVGGCKAVVDSLVNVGLLVDDSEQWVDDYYLQRRHEHLSGVEVVLQEVMP